MAERLTGERLIKRVREISDSSDDERALKSRICVGCGYVHDNGLPDFVGFYNALKEAKQSSDVSSVEAGTTTPQRTQEIYGEIRDELRQFADYLADQEPEYSDSQIKQKRENMISRITIGIISKFESRLAASPMSQYQLRLKLAKLTGFSLLLPDLGLSKLSEHYWEADEVEKYISTVSALLRRSPENTEVIFQRAIRFKILERYNEAITDLTKLIDLGIKTDVAYRYRAECKLESKDHAGAEEDAQRALRLRTNNLNATGAYEILRDVEEANGNVGAARKIQQKIDALKRLPILLEFINEEEQVNYKRHDFESHWRRYREEIYQPIKESSDVPFDLDSLFEFSRMISAGEALEEWERESICIRATDELAKFPLMFRESEEEAALMHKLNGPVRHYVSNLKKGWADHYVEIAIEIIATVKEMIEPWDIDKQRQKTRAIAEKVRSDIYEAIQGECERYLADMDRFVKLTRSRSPFASAPDPLLTKEHLADGRLSAIWGETDKVAGDGKSYTYLFDFEGDICVKEFDPATPYVNKPDIKQLPYIAALIVHDIYGEYDWKDTASSLI